MPEYEFHPLASEYALLPDDQLEYLVASMKRDGFCDLFPIVLADDGGTTKILDGRNRYRAALKAGVQPEFIELPPGYSPEAFVRLVNEDRRHLLAQWLRDRRAQRIAAKRDEGKSLRSIAEEEGVSLVQVQRDLECASAPAGVPGGVHLPAQQDTAAHEPQTTKGRDGKSYPAKKPKADDPQRLWCDRCKRLGKQAFDCNACKSIRDQAAAAAKKRKDTPKKKPREELKDRTGRVVPDSCRDAFADPALGNLIEELEQVEAMFRPESWLDRAVKLCDHYGFLLADKFREHVYEAVAELQLAAEALRAGVPHAVCPLCNGEDSRKANGTCCKGCRGYGHVPETRWNELASR